MLNLPDSIAFVGKGYIKYIYSADGSKMQKIVIDNTINKKTVTTYLSSFVYQYTASPSTGSGSDTLQYILQPEGRIRPQTVAKSDTMNYDFFEKDHLGNTRVVLTDQKEQDSYHAATLENNSQAYQTEEAYYTINSADTISTSRIPSWSSTSGNNYPNNNGNPPYNNDPYANTSATSAIVYHLNGATGDKSGLGITLKVMAGDQVSIFAKSFWHNNTGSNPVNNYLLSSVVNSFIAAFAGTPTVAAEHGATATALEGSTLTSSGVASWLQNGVPNPSQATVPRAYVNWILFNDQFVPVASNCGFDLVSVSPDVVKSHTPVVNIGTSGYLYVYCSNESNVDVYFDNLQVMQTRGPLLETTDYYPFGLTMAGISDKALKTNYAENKYRWNKGSELQNKEFSDGSGLEMYETPLRELDPQLGRWWQTDPAFTNGVDGDDEVDDVIVDGLKSQSAYASMDNNPIRLDDPNGDCPPCALEIAIESAQAGTAAGAAGSAAATGYSNGSTMGPGEAMVDATRVFFSGVWAGMVKFGHLFSGSSSSTTASAPTAPTATAPPGTPTAPTATAHPGTPSSPTATHPPTTANVNAHGQKKQSTGSKKAKGDNHMRQYKNYKKGNKKNPNLRHGAEQRRINNKPID